MRTIRAIFLLVCLCGAARAGGLGDAGTTSAAFLQLGSGSRSEALGEAYVALSDDPEGMAYNPAGLAQMLKGELVASHALWLQGMTYDNLDAALSLGDGGVAGASFDYLAIPQIARTEQIADTADPELNYVQVGTFSPFDLQGSLAYARPVLRGLLAGGAVKFINENVAGAGALGLGLDLGLLYQAPLRGLTAGLAVQNLGPPMRFESEASPLPLVARVGAAYRMLDDSLLVSVEEDAPQQDAPVFAAGLEYNIAGRFYPRAGWRYDGQGNPWTLGFGLKYLQWGLDLSVVPYGDLGLSYRGGVHWEFGRPDASLELLQAFAGAAGPEKDALMDAHMSAADQVRAWALYIYDSGSPARIVRTLKGQGAPEGPIAWDGREQNGQAAPEGAYPAILVLRYNSGQIVDSPYVRLEVIDGPPAALIAVDPSSVNPADSREAFIPTLLKPGLRSGRGISAWRVDILDPWGGVFRSLSGKGSLPASLLWDGKGDQGQDLISAQVYSARLWVQDALGGESTSPAVSFKAVFR
jgi:hypothetical protein